MTDLQMRFLLCPIYGGSALDFALAKGFVWRDSSVNIHLVSFHTDKVTDYLHQFRVPFSVNIM